MNECSILTQNIWGQCLQSLLPQTAWCVECGTVGSVLSDEFHVTRVQVSRGGCTVDVVE